METKSRYEVISDLERQKRELIQERDGLGDVLLGHQKELKMLQRQLDDHNVVANRHIEDRKEDIETFRQTVDSKKVTIEALIKSVDDSLKRFSSMPKK